MRFHNEKHRCSLTLCFNIEKLYMCINIIVAWKRERKKNIWHLILLHLNFLYTVDDCIVVCELKRLFWNFFLRRVFDLVLGGIRVARRRYGATPCIFRWPLNTSIAINKQWPLPMAQYDAISLYLQSAVNLTGRGKGQNKSDSYRSTRPRFLLFAFVSIR